MLSQSTSFSSSFGLKSTLAALVVVLSLAGPASADFTMYSTLSDPREGSERNSFIATVGLQSIGGGVSKLTIDLYNKTNSSNPGGYITGVSFSTPTGASYLANSFTTSNTHFSILNGPVSVSPFPSEDLGAALGGSWSSGGITSQGIKWSALGTNHVVLTFNFTGTALSESMFKDAFAGTTSDPGFLVRFRGLSDGNSNTVVGIVPEPGSVMLLGIGLAGVTAFGLRKRRLALAKAQNES